MEYIIDLATQDPLKRDSYVMAMILLGSKVRLDKYLAFEKAFLKFLFGNLRALLRDWLRMEEYCLPLLKNEFDCFKLG